MSIKLKALLQLIGIIAAGLAGGGLVLFVTTTFSPETIRFMLGGGLVGGMLYFCYGVLVARLEYQAKIDKIVNKSVDK